MFSEIYTLEFQWRGESPNYRLINQCSEKVSTESSRLIIILLSRFLQQYFNINLIADMNHSILFRTILRANKEELVTEVEQKSVIHQARSLRNEQQIYFNRSSLHYIIVPLSADSLTSHSRYYEWVDFMFRTLNRFQK